MKNSFSFIVLLAVWSTSFGQDQKITTFILIRHAEKVADGSKDPELSQEGIDRAFRLATLLKNTNVGAVYSTDYKRTKNTVARVAKDKGVEVQLYSPSNPADLDKIISQNEGKTILVVGHSNTIPGLANQLVGRTDFENFPDAEYGTILIVPIVAKGKAGNVIQLNY